MHKDRGESEETGQTTVDALRMLSFEYGIQIYSEVPAETDMNARKVG